MNISAFTSGGNVYVKHNRINRVAFKIAALWDNCALLPHICANLAHTWDNSAIFHNRTECLSLRGFAA